MQIQQQIRVECQLTEAGGTLEMERWRKGLHSYFQDKQEQHILQVVVVVTTGNEHALHNSETRVRILFSPYRSEKYLRW